MLKTQTSKLNVILILVIFTPATLQRLALQLLFGTILQRLQRLGLKVTFWEIQNGMSLFSQIIGSKVRDFQKMYQYRRILAHFYKKCTNNAEYCHVFYKKRNKIAENVSKILQFVFFVFFSCELFYSAKIGKTAPPKLLQLHLQLEAKGQSGRCVLVDPNVIGQSEIR